MQSSPVWLGESLLIKHLSSFELLQSFDMILRDVTFLTKTRWEGGPHYAGVPPTLVTFKKLDEMEEIWKTFKERKEDYGVVVTQVQQLGSPCCQFTRLAK